MSSNSNIATHDGIVISSANGKVCVEMQVVSACSICKSHEKCAFVDKDKKVVEIDTDNWQQYNVGQNVIVSVNESLGLLAVLLAYILPALIIVGSVVLLSSLCQSEVVAASVSIVIIAVYFIVLYRFRNRLQKKFTFSLTKNQ